jgi:hypothetical protein
MESAGEILVKSVIEGVALVAVLVILYEIHRVASAYCAQKRGPERPILAVKRYRMADGYSAHEPSEEGDWVLFNDVGRLVLTKDMLEEDIQRLKARLEESQAEVSTLRRVVAQDEDNITELKARLAGYSSKKEE